MINKNSGFLANRDIDLVSDYVSRGRQYKILTIKQLHVEWVSAFLRLAHDPLNTSANRVESDFIAEFRLRGETPPYDLVKSDGAEYRARFDEALREKLEEDGKSDEFWDAVADELAPSRETKGQKN